MDARPPPVSPSRRRASNAAGLVALATALALSGCANALSSLPFGRANPTGATTAGTGAATATVDPATTYLVSLGTAATGAPAFGIGGLDGASVLAGAGAAAGATVVFPDGSTALTGPSGTFDASQTSWAAALAPAAAANPGLTGSVVAFSASQPALATPATAGVLAYAPPQPARAAASGDAALVAVDVEPAGVVLGAGQTQTFTALGRYSDGELAAGGVTGLAWSLAKPPGCGAPTGSLAPDASDPQRARYLPPAGGSSALSCPDLVTATAPGGGGRISGGTGVVVSNGSPAATLAALVDRSGNPLSGAIVDAAGSAASGPAVAAVTSSGGLFRAAMPTNRAIVPSAFVPVAGSSAYAPTQIAASDASHWSVLGTPPVPAAAPMPGDQLVRDAEFLARIAWEPFPFGEMPSPDGETIPGSLQALLAEPVAIAAGSAGTLSGGPYGAGRRSVYQGAAYAVDTAGTTIAIADRPTAPPYALLVLTRDGGPVPCPTAATCFSYLRYRSFAARFDPAKPVPPGATLDVGGWWAQSTTGTTATVSLAEDDYDGGHQTVGSPLLVHAATIGQNLGAEQLTIDDAVTTPAGTPLATQSFSRDLCSTVNLVGPCAARGALYAMAGSTVRTLVRADGGAVTVRYALGAPGPLAASVAACPQAYCLPASDRAPGSVAFEYAIASSPAQGDVGAELAWLEPGTSPGGGTAVPLSGVLSTGYFASDASGTISLTELAGAATVTASFPR